LPKFLKTLFKKNMRKDLQGQKQTLKPRQKKEIKEKLYSDMLKFQKEYNFDVSKWGFE